MVRTVLSFTRCRDRLPAPPFVCLGGKAAGYGLPSPGAGTVEKNEKEKVT